MVTYIEVSLGTKIPFDESAYAMWYGCRQLDVETRTFDFLQDVEPDPEHVVHGKVRTVLRALRRLQVPPPPPLDAPEPLLPFFGRRIWTTTLGAIREHRGRVFIKPAEDQKAFTGFVADDPVQTMVRTAPFPNDMPLLASEPVTFVAEYRIMVHHRRLIACRHYSGDFTTSPDFSVAYAAVRAFTAAPCAYSLDLGVTNDDRTLIVEVNDAWALGSYGTPPMLYARMIADRWRQLVGLE